MADGLSSALGDLGVASLDTDAVSGAVIADQGIGAGKIKNAALTATQMANNAASGAIVSSEYATDKTGSPAVGGNSIQFGTITGAGSPARWVAFGKPFGAAPTVAITPVGSQAVPFSYLVSVVAGSLSFVGGSTLTHHYVAAGSLRV